MDTDTAQEVDAPASGHALKRVLLKLSGEMFGGGKIGIDPDVVNGIAKQVAEAVAEGVEVAIVVGGGQLPRRRSSVSAAWTVRAPTTSACSAPS